VGSIEGKTLGAVVDLLEAYARVLLAIAEVEEATGKRFDEFLRGLFTPEKLRDLYNKLPGEVYGEFMASLLKLVSISSTFQNPLTLPASEKKRVSGEVKEVAESIRKVVDRLKAGRNGQGGY